MRVVTLEEHFFVPALIGRHMGGEALSARWLTPQLKGALADLGAARLRDMDASGITTQVISATVPGADLLDGEDGIRFAIETNNHLAEAVHAHPGRFAGFAHLPMRSPEAAAYELQRAVQKLGFRGAMINGLTQGVFLDDARFSCLLSCAEALDVPIYLHPNAAPKPVFDAYYQGLPGVSGALLGTAVFGWHSETAIHIFRLALSGALERHSTLKLIVGHMGEMLPFMLARADDVLMSFGGFDHPISETIVDRVYITTSGMFTTAPFLNAFCTFGADRILFSVDYPYSSNVPARAWLDQLPVSPADKIKIAHGNADRLLKIPTVEESCAASVLAQGALKVRS